MRKLRKFGQCLLCFSLLQIPLVFYTEFLHHHIVISQCNWRYPINADITDDVTHLRVLLLADTHLLGSRLGHWLDRLRREWQMHRSYMTAVYTLRPHLVVFLGASRLLLANLRLLQTMTSYTVTCRGSDDPCRPIGEDGARRRCPFPSPLNNVFQVPVFPGDLYDEGKWCGAQEFNEYIHRFNQLFPVQQDQRRLVVAGNHDIGFHYSVRPTTVTRFDAAHNTSGVQLVTPSPGVHLVLINSVAMEGDSCRLCAAAQNQLDEIARDLHCAESGECHPRRKELLNFSRPIILQHYPLFRTSDSHCAAGADSAPPGERDGNYRPGWDCLTRAASRQLLELVRPRLVVSGHTHHYCRTEHRTDGRSDPVTEYSVASFSWRNKPSPSFLMLEVARDRHHVGKCNMACENTVFVLYTVGEVAAVLLTSLIMSRISSWRRANLHLKIG